VFELYVRIESGGFIKVSFKELELISPVIDFYKWKLGRTFYFPSGSPGSMPNDPCVSLAIMGYLKMD